ncbi:MAG: bifunctional transaldolase/phosoglucose isomerase [Nitrospiraceae bacterium]|nr:bifunctional transaldolase/phosoglucose isomerase [Nitrospiraceae bacterium]
MGTALTITKNPLRRLESSGQSVWMDFIRRRMLYSGELKKLIDEDGLTGITSNPSIFEKVISGSHDYDDALRALVHEGRQAMEIYEALVVEDVRMAADLLRPVYDSTGGQDGFVSLEVSPELAYDAGKTIAEAKRLWAAVDRPNMFIKVPAAKQGIPAIQKLTADGINVNVTLLFSLTRYREAAGAYIDGLKQRVFEGLPVDRIASVASFFLSRIDVLVDPMLEKIIQSRDASAGIAATLRGQAATACAKAAYRIYKEIFEGPEFCHLIEKGANVQRLLWASTSAKNPAYEDIKYIEPLIGMRTVNTMPLETINAYRRQGDPADRINSDMEGAYSTLRLLKDIGIDMDRAAQRLEDEGVRKFAASYEELLSSIEKKRAGILKEPVSRQIMRLGDLDFAVRERANYLENLNFNERLWRKDASLWKSGEKEAESIRGGLGWLHVAEKMESNINEIYTFGKEVRDAGFRHAVLLGMGGSSLAPLALRQTFGDIKGGLPLTVLDSTGPAAILGVEREIPLEKTFFIVASKSGTTAETIALFEYFYSKVKAAKGPRAGENFAAITDPGTPLEAMALERGFHRTFLNFRDIGGRYSALSYFGMVPASLMGINIGALLARSLRMSHACSSSVSVADSPGASLGAAIGELALNGKDKLTFLIPGHIKSLGLWLEQLIAESTGKEGKGILPVADEPAGGPETYGDDRIFVYIRQMGLTDEFIESAAGGLKKAGKPVITIAFEDLYDLGQEFFRWETAAAAAGSVLGINPFDQPDVEETKKNTNRLLEQVSQKGALGEPEPILRDGGLSFYSENPEDKKAKDARELISGFFGRGRQSGYIAIQAYLSETPEVTEKLQAMRCNLKGAFCFATTLGFGPRFLHSTGQFHKGGPDKGLFLQLTSDDPADVDIPGRPYTFGIFRRAQALGDMQALTSRGRRFLRVHLGKDAIRGLEALSAVMESAFSERSIK